MVSGTCSHGKALKLRVKQRLAKPASARVPILRICCGADSVHRHKVKHGYRRSRSGHENVPLAEMKDIPRSPALASRQRLNDPNDQNAPETDRRNTRTTSGSTANSTVTMSVSYRQRLNGPNVKSTSGSTAGCSQFVVLLRGPGKCTSRLLPYPSAWRHGASNLQW